MVRCMNKIKVVHFIDGMGIGGAQVLVKDYALLLDKNKFDVTVLCLNRENTFLDKVLEDAGIHTIYISDYLPLFKTLYLKNSLVHRIVLKTGIMKFLFRYLIRKEKPNILHFHLLFSSYVKFANIPQSCILIHTIHSQPEKYWCVNKSFEKKDFNALNYLIHTHGVQLITLNHNAKDVANKLFDLDNTLVLNNAINFEKYKISETKEEIRKTLGIKNDTYLVGNIGRFSPVKNHTLMVKAFYELSKKRMNAHLLLVGDGDVELRKKIISEINSLGLKNRVTILNARTDVPRLLKAMDVFIFPSLYEGLGIVLIEAQKMGVPSVISNAIPEEAVVSNLVCRMKADASPTDYADVLMNFQVNKVEYYGIEKWDMNIVVKQLENIYIQSMSQKK